MSRPHRLPRSRFPFQTRCAEPLEPRLLLATGPAYLVKDINATSASSDPFSFVPFKGLTYFRANDGLHGIEWFRTDGTPAGTSMLTDLVPGAAGSIRPTDFPGVDIHEVSTAGVLGDSLLFAASTPATGAELWKTDGTAAGTVLVKDIRPGSQGSGPQKFIAVGGTMYFTAEDAQFHRQLWRTDGTAAGTQPLTSIPGTSTLTPYPLGVVGGRLLFGAPAPDADGTAGVELWATDGTPAGTAVLKNINPSGGSIPGLMGGVDSYYAVSNGVLYFSATEPTHGRQLWRSDGTPDGTTLVSDLLPGADPTNLTDVNGTLYFTQSLSGGRDSGVYRRDPATGAISQIGTVAYIGGAVTSGSAGGLFYLGTWANNHATLFKDDPAMPASGLTVVKELSLNTSWNLRQRVLDVNGKAVLLAQGPTGTTEIHVWRSDGTAAGTVDLATYQGATAALVRGAGGLLYFGGKDPVAGAEPVRTDGTAAGTFLAADVNGATPGSDPTATVYLGNNRWVFVATEPVHGREVWGTNGTDAGTMLLKDIFPGTGYSIRDQVPTFSPPLNGRTFFAAAGDSADYDDELWTTDGTPAGTYRLKDWLRNNGGPRGFAVLNGKMYFTAGTSDRGMWESDGTVEGTKLVYPLDRVTFGPLTHVGDMLYFTAYSENIGSELWQTDGTAAGTRAVSAHSRDPVGTAAAPVVMDGVQYYLAPAGPGTTALWRDDGTDGGKQIVKQLPGEFTHVVVAGDRLLVSRGAPYEQAASDIWVSDGTPDNTVTLESLVPALAGFAGDPGAGGDVQLIGAAGAAYFFGHAGIENSGVWRTDGTAAGTRLVHFFPAEMPLSNLGVSDGQVTFSAGPQLWRTDGTEAGTVQVGDAPAGNDGGPLTFFAHSDPLHGNELWAMEKEVTEVYVRGSAWANSFKSYLEAKGLGDDAYGIPVADNGAGGVLLPWVNLDQVVVRLPLDRIGGMPTSDMVTIQSQRGTLPNYFATRVEAVPGDPRAFVFFLDRPLGGEGSDAARNGDRLTLNIPGAGTLGTNLVARLTVLQGDVDASGVVLAADFSAVKKKFFKNTTSAPDPSNPSADYSPFHDVDGSGVILANDFSLVKSRFFQSLPPTPAVASAPAGARSPSRPVTRDLFSRAPLLR